MLLAFALLACHSGVDDSGTSGPPDICLELPSVDFGGVELGTYAFVKFHIGNCGGGVLDIASITATGSGAFTFADAESTSIPAHQTEVALVSYRPEGTTGDTGALEVESNDPDEPTVLVTLTGHGE